MNPSARVTAPVASVVVPTHQGVHRLRSLLPRLADQDFHEPWQLVIVVDGSDHGSIELVESWRESFERPGRPVSLTLLVNPIPLGVAGAVDRGFAAATGTYIIRCDDDLEPPRSFVSDHVSGHAGRRDLGLVAPTRDRFPNTPYARAYGRIANERALEAAYAQPPHRRWLHWAACCSVHRDAWARSGGFDPRFAYGEDSELGYRLMRQGVELRVVRDLEIVHTCPATSATTRVPRAFIAGASRRLFLELHPEATFAPAGRTRGVKAMAWTIMVGALSSLLRTPKAYARLGAALDRLLEIVPASAGGPLVALAVESAGRSGVRHGSTDLHRYRGQKDAEVDAEVRRASRTD